MFRLHLFKGKFRWQSILLNFHKNFFLQLPLRETVLLLKTRDKPANYSVISKYWKGWISGFFSDFALLLLLCQEVSIDLMNENFSLCIHDYNLVEWLGFVWFGKMSVVMWSLYELPMRQCGSEAWGKQTQATEPSDRNSGVNFSAGLLDSNLLLTVTCYCY